MNEQKKVEKMVDSLVKRHGLEEAISLIKRDMNLKIQNYQNGVYIYCNSPEGGVLVGECPSLERWKEAQ